MVSSPTKVANLVKENKSGFSASGNIYYFLYKGMFNLIFFFIEEIIRFFD